MQLDYDRPDYAQVLRAANGASALVNDRTLVRSFVIAPDELVEDWPVAEGAKVSAGQQIAEMGRTGADRDMLHFEIRHDGKPVDPQRYLPRK